MPKKNEAQKRTHPWKGASFSREHWEEKRDKQIKLALKRFMARQYCEPSTQELLAEIRGETDYPKRKLRKDYTIVGPQTSEEWLCKKKSEGV